MHDGRRQRGPTSAHRTHKQKRTALKEARRRQRERDELRLSEAAPESSAPKVVQARLYPAHTTRGGSLTVRLKLSIDRQLCAGFVGGDGRTPSSVLVAQSVNEQAEDAEEEAPPLNAAQRSARQLAGRASALQARLGALAKLKSRSDMEREWVDGVNTCVQLLVTAGALQRDGPATGPASTRPFLFSLVQSCLQTGPSLNFGRPAQFKRMKKALNDDRRAARGVGEHPHVRATRRLLEAVTALVAAGTAAGDGSAAAGAADITADDGAAALVDQGAGEPPATDAEPGEPPATGMGMVATAFSEKQCGAIRVWQREFDACFLQQAT